MEDQLIPGANDTLDWLQQQHIPYRFITNNTTLPRKKLIEKLNILGLRVKEDELVSANYAGVLYLKKQNFTVCRLVLMEAAKADYKGLAISTCQPDAIVIGDIGASWDYILLNELMNQVLEGSRLIALHKGRYFQTEKGLTLDSGAFVAALEHATQTVAVVLGKPETTFFELATQDFNCRSEEIAMIGDDLINDIGGAQKMGYSTFLVKTGKFRQSLYQKSNIEPDHLIDTIANLKDYTLTNSLI